MSEQTPTVVLVDGDAADVIAAGPLFAAGSTCVDLSVQAVSRPHGFGA